MIRIDLTGLMSYNDCSPCRTLVHEDESIRVLLICFRAGQAVEPCVMERDVLFLVIKGHGVVVAEQEIETLEPGTIVTIPKGVERVIKADDDLVVVGVQITGLDT